MVRVLVADDHETMRKGVRSILSERESIEVSEAATGKKAVEKARETPPDLLILDINMPVMGGFEAAREINLDKLESGKVIEANLSAGE